MKHPKYLWFTAILVFLLQLGALLEGPGDKLAARAEKRISSTKAL
jgi:hypothetical protein